MEITAFQCDTCGGNISLDDLYSIVVCPYCKKDFYVNHDWEEDLRIATKNTERVLVKNIQDIKIPDVKENILLRDIDIFKKINQSLIFLEREMSDVNTKRTTNESKIDCIENTIGLSYEGLRIRVPKKLSEILYENYIIFSCAIAIFVFIDTTIKANFFLEFCLV